MLFQGTFDTAFYRQVRNALHLDVDLRRTDEGCWRELAERAPSHQLVAQAARLSA
jgi:anaerobic magnesium-protoporphyrin IX monomethyl ester cyclase